VTVYAIDASLAAGIDTKRLRELAEAATRGQWEHTGWTESESNYIVDGPGDRIVADTSESERPDADAAFIAAANPTTVLALLDEIDRLSAKVSDMRSERLRVESKLAAVTVARDSLAGIAESAIAPEHEDIHAIIAELRKAGQP
jgi:hypothetical protein